MSPDDPAQKPVECAGAVVCDDAGRLLLVQRGHEPSIGLWSLPGGRVEPGESAAEAAAREVQEETGLMVEVGDLLATVRLGDYLVHDFAATVTGGELAAGDDAADVRWCDVDELDAIELSAGLLEELRRIGAIPSRPS
jgi:8-oxo-dGTP diphosphatase